MYNVQSTISPNYNAAPSIDGAPVRPIHNVRIRKTQKYLRITINIYIYIYVYISNFNV